LFPNTRSERITGGQLNQKGVSQWGAASRG
jgi:hypothetical protein